MALLLFLGLILTPIAEIAVFIEVGGRIGLWPTVGVIILTALIGTALLRWQGMATLFNVQKSLEQNRLPVKEVFDGLCLLLAGALLLTPGFVTDAVGLLLFVPAFRSILGRAIGKYLIASGRIDMQTDVNREFRSEGTVIEGEFHEVHSEDSAQDEDIKKTKLPPSTP